GFRRSGARIAALAALALLGAFVPGCKPDESHAGAAAQAVVPTSPATAEADQIFSTRCVMCHGSTGAGDGPASASLYPKPRNFHDAAWQTSITDENIGKIVQSGGAAVGKSNLMPGNPDLEAKPQTVQALVKKIRGFGSGAEATKSN